MDQGITLLRDLIAIQVERHKLAKSVISDRTGAEYLRHLFEQACLERQLDLIDTLIDDTASAVSYLQMAVDHERCMLAVQQDRRIPT